MAHFARAHSQIEPAAIGVPDVLLWAATRAWAPETRHSYYASFTSFWTWQLGAPVEFPHVRRPQGVARVLPDLLFESLLASPDPRICLGAHLAAGAGLRRSEIAVISIHDISDDLLGRSLTVHGKGGRTRLVPLSAKLDEAVASYVEDYAITGYLFPGDIDGHISATWLGKLINNSLPKPWSMHCLRHRFATRVYQATKDLVVVQQLLGHESIATTQRYLAFTPDSLRHAVDMAA
ncbi:MAG: tyrosine-type recombinase/integrase [Propionibacteriaceae bacterium]|nr:tyrosine-type recombinase/integrase [Propionibacteriaceae bacterium]